jgi:hypothetical protein
MLKDSKVLDTLNVYASILTDRCNRAEYHEACRIADTIDHVEKVIADIREKLN